MNKQFSISNIRRIKSPSIERHQRQKIRQIFLPLACIVVIIMGVCVLVILAASRSTPGGAVSQWADTSAIWLIMPVMMFTVIGAVVLGGLIFLLARLLKILPQYSNLVQNYAGLIAARVGLVTHKMVTPILSYRSTLAGLKGFLSSLLGIRQKL